MDDTLMLCDFFRYYAVDRLPSVAILAQGVLAFLVWGRVASSNCSTDSLSLLSYVHLCGASRGPSAARIQFQCRSRLE
jgi:hypothetical protein